MKKEKIKREFFLNSYPRLFLVLAGFMAVIFLISLITFNILRSGEEEVTVPNVSQLSLIDAIDILQSKKLQPYVMAQSSGDVPAFTVIAQKTKAGSVVRKGRNVVISVSIGPSWLDLPDFTGKKIQEVRAILNSIDKEKQKIHIKKINWKNSDEASGTIISQHPKGKKMMNKQIELTLWVSNGSRRKLPSVKNRYLQEAIHYLSKNQVEYQYRFKDVNDKKQDGKVINQTPQAGTIIKSDTLVKLTIGKWKERKEDLDVIRYTIPEKLNRKKIQIAHFDNRGKKILFEGRVYTGETIVRVIASYGTTKCLVYEINGNKRKFIEELEL